MEQRSGRVEARYKITSGGHTALGEIDADEIINLAHDLVWALQALGVEQSTTICKLVYQEAEFARLFAKHTKDGIRAESKVPLPIVTEANNETFVTLTALQKLLPQETKGKSLSLPMREVVRVYLRNLAMQVPC